MPNDNNDNEDWTLRAAGRAREVIERIDYAEGKRGNSRREELRKALEEATRVVAYLTMAVEER